MTKKNKGVLIAVYCLVAVLVLSTIVCCFVKTSYRPEIQDPYAFTAYISGNADSYIACDKDNNKDRYNEVLTTFNDSFTESVLSSLFSGRMFSKSRIESSQSLPSFSGYTLKLSFATKQTIMLNGKEYNPPTNSSQTIEYDEIYVDVAGDNGFGVNYVYYVYNYVDSSNINRTTYYKQTVKANFNELYDLLESY